MHDIRGPHCDKAFKVDETGYADIVKQVRDHEFDSQLVERLCLAEREKQDAIELVKSQTLRQAQTDSAAKDAQVQALQAEIAAAALEQQLAVSQAVNAVEKKYDAVSNQLQSAALEKKLSEQALKDKYETQIKDRDDAIDRLKDLKARLSTKMLGETLEQHCETAFNQIRATAFPKAYFEKDNDAQSGSKGDFIFRDFDDNKRSSPSCLK